ncbi:MAG: hypothetical protein ACJ786_11645 [Catenulispora sp.]
MSGSGALGVRAAADPRHLLLIASQCCNKPVLKTLARTAADLETALLDPDGGGCDPGLPDGTALLSGDIGLAEAEAALRDAIAYAADRGATLVLGFLGHGFVPGNTSRLHYMTAESCEDVESTALNVQAFVTAAVGQIGVAGVIVLADTCHAAGAAPPTADVVAGTRLGQVSLSMIMASAAGAEAYGLHVSASLVRFIRWGSPRLPEKVTVADAAEFLRGEVHGQDIAVYQYGGDHRTTGADWLARNPAHNSGDSVGVIGRDAVTEVMAGLGEHSTLARYAARPARLRAELDGLPVGLHVDRAVRISEILRATGLTVDFLRSRVPDAIGPGPLREALSAVANWRGRRRPMRGAPQLATEVDFVEFLAFLDATLAEPYQVGLARFVVALTDAAGVGPKDPDLLAWAADISARVEVNAALAVIRETRERRRTRLVVGLRGTSGEGQWPESVEAWLLCDRGLVGRGRFNVVGAPDQRSVERLISEAVDWAEEHPATGGPLERIDIAASAWMLLTWRPEDVRHVRLLGLDYDVVSRWSDLLGPDTPAVPSRATASGIASPNHTTERAAGRLRRHKRRLLAELVAARDSDGALGWLSAGQMADPDAVERGLVDGSYGPAVGLTEHPGDRVQLLEALLSYSPAVIWPHPDRGESRSVAGAESPMDAVAARWLLLPAAFRHAYRRIGDPLATLRAVWDDEEWLDFCQNFDTPLGLGVMT